MSPESKVKFTSAGPAYGYHPSGEREEVEPCQAIVGMGALLLSRVAGPLHLPGTNILLRDSEVSQERSPGCLVVEIPGQPFPTRAVWVDTGHLP